MSLELETLAKEIHSLLHLLAGELKSLTRHGLNDGAKLLEVTSMRLLNTLHDWDLRDLNEVKKNHPAADLGDFTRRIAVQVTNNATADKIKDTRIKALDPQHQLARDFDTLFILFFVPEKPKTPKGLLQSTDQPKIETWDLSDLLAKLLKAEPDCLRKVLAVLKRELTHHGLLKPSAPKLFPPRFIHHAAEHFFGREPQLALLDEAWTNSTNVLSIIAWGGVGKTALFTEWVQTRFIDKQWKADDGQPALAAYFDWTFYDQGTRSLADGTEARTGSVGDFFEQALVFFGDSDPNLPGKGRRLADLIRQQRSLIILDGLEPLQQPPGHPQAGRLLDPDLRDLLAALAQSNPGLCLITSRQALTDLHSLRRTVHTEHELEDLPVVIAIRLLRQLQIKGTDQELAAASEKFGCHALSLTLLGRYLFDAHDGDIRRLDRIDLQRADDLTRDSRQRSVWRILETYEHWLATAQADGNPKTLAVLRLTGLFDRTATADCLVALRAAPIIPGLTDAICGMADDEWNILLKRLERAHLIKLRDSSNTTTSKSGARWDIDAHPLIREYFATRLNASNSRTFQILHSRLFDHLARTTLQFPTSLVGLQPLYQAVYHGCLAQRHQEACDVYVDRIQRKQHAFSTRMLGAIGSDFSAVSMFFDAPWTKVSKGLSKRAESWALNEAAYCLRALGRLDEAITPMTEAVTRAESEEVWPNATRGASNLSELKLILGSIDEAVTDARTGLDSAIKHKLTFEAMACLCSSADAVHQSGRCDEARKMFEALESLQRAVQPTSKCLYSIPGYRYADLLLSRSEVATWHAAIQGTAPPESAQPTFDNIIERAEYSIKVSHEAEFGLIGNGIALLLLARSRFYRDFLKSAPQENESTGSVIRRSLICLRETNEMPLVQLALLTAAFYHGTLGENLEEAERLLEEAQQIAERGPMPLYLADVHLHRARLFGRMNADERKQKFPDIDPKAELHEARRLIEKHGYWRRKEELEDAEAAAVSW